MLAHAAASSAHAHVNALGVKNTNTAKATNAPLKPNMPLRKRSRLAPSHAATKVPAPAPNTTAKASTQELQAMPATNNTPV